MTPTSFETYPHCTQFMTGSLARPQNIEYVTLQTLKEGGKTAVQAMNTVIDMIFDKLNEQPVIIFNDGQPAVLEFIKKHLTTKKIRYAEINNDRDAEVFHDSGFTKTKGVFFVTAWLTRGFDLRFAK